MKTSMIVVLPENATDKTVTRAVCNGSTPGAVTVENGLVTAMEEGTAVIRALSAENPEIYSDCNVTTLVEEHYLLIKPSH